MGLLKSLRQKISRKLCFCQSKSSSDSNNFKRLDDSAENKTCQTQEGCVPVYIGKQKLRCEIPLQYLSFEKFQDLILEPFGGDLEFVKNEGPIELPDCTTKLLHQVLDEAKEYYSTKIESH